jgi:hypothetical protein
MNRMADPVMVAIVKAKKKNVGNRGPKRGHNPTKLTPEVYESILDYLRKGNYFETAAALSGASVDTARDWLRYGRKPDGPELFRRFVADVGVANAEAEASVLAHVARLGKRDWVACMTFLERRFPDRWGRRERKGQVNVNLTASEVAKLTDAELDKLIERFSSDSGG